MKAILLIAAALIAGAAQQANAINNVTLKSGEAGMSRTQDGRPADAYSPLLYQYRYTQHSPLNHGSTTHFGFPPALRQPVVACFGDGEYGHAMSASADEDDAGFALWTQAFCADDKSSSADQQLDRIT